MKKMLKLQPCKPDCPERTETCHATCPKWKEWQLVRYLMWSSESHQKEVAGKKANSILIEGSLKARRKRNIERIRRGRRS